MSMNTGLDLREKIIYPPRPNNRGDKNIILFLDDPAR
jgi:hypothetical protein